MVIVRYIILISWNKYLISGDCSGILFRSLERNTKLCYGCYYYDVDCCIFLDRMSSCDCSVFYSDPLKEIPNCVMVVSAVRSIVVFFWIECQWLYTQVVYFHLWYYHNTFRNNLIGLVWIQFTDLFKVRVSWVFFLSISNLNTITSHPISFLWYEKKLALTLFIYK